MTSVAGSKTMRCFLALYPDDAARDALSEYISSLKRVNPSMKWEKDSQIHITVKFLGDIQRSTLPKLRTALSEIHAKHGPINACIDNVGAFPNFQRPSLLWLGFGERIPVLEDVQMHIESLCSTLGFENESKGFTPHFTIGRVKRHLSFLHLQTEIEKSSFQPIPVLFTSLRIMESTLTASGAIHRECFSVAL